MATLESEIKHVVETCEIKVVSEGAIRGDSNAVSQELHKFEEDEREMIFMVSKAESHLETLNGELSESNKNIREMEDKMEHLKTVVGAEFAGDNGLETFEKVMSEVEEKVREARETQRQFEVIFYQLRLFILFAQCSMNRAQRNFGSSC